MSVVTQSHAAASLASRFFSFLARSQRNNLFGAATLDWPWLVMVMPNFMLWFAHNVALISHLNDVSNRRRFTAANMKLFSIFGMETVLPPQTHNSYLAARVHYAAIADNLSLTLSKMFSLTVWAVMPQTEIEKYTFGLFERYSIEKHTTFYASYQKHCKSTWRLTISNWHAAKLDVPSE